MRKGSISKFIDRSKEIINLELDDEKSEAFVDFDQNSIEKEEENMVMFKGQKENSDEALDAKVETKETVEVKHDDFRSGTDSTSTIASDVVITGNISAKGNLNFDGTIDGDIECHQNLKVGGSVKGNVKASYATLRCDKIVGNIECENLCEVLGSTAIKGDVTAANLILEGSVTGTINAKEKVTLCSSAVLEGDCITSRLKIDEGAVVRGNIQMTTDAKTK